jgi:DNA-binding LytR/AlgR family response regulator
VTGNILLLTAALAALAGIAQVGGPPARRLSDAPDPKSIAVKRRGETLLLEPGSIDWIEAQGNYLALHVGPDTHLARGVLNAMERDLEPQGFARVHRGALVNLSRVRRLQTLACGDAWLELENGVRVRASRTYGRTLKAILSPKRTADG